MSYKQFQEFEKKIISKGYKEIGGGSAAIVYSNGKDVYKLYPQNPNKREKIFINFCVKHRQNHNIQFVEKYNEMGTWSYFKSKLYKKIQKSDWNTNRNLIELRIYGEHLDYGDPVTNSHVRMTEINKEKQLVHFKTTNLYRTLESIKRLFPKIWDLDLHDTNIMYDNSKNVVIIDI